MRQNKTVVAAGAALFLILVIWNWPSRQPHTDFSDLKREQNLIYLTDEQISANELNVQTAGPGELAFTLTAPGKIRIDSDKHIHVLPYLQGYVAEVHKGNGDAVMTGDLLAVLESQEMAEAAANYLTAMAKENLAAALLKQEAQLAAKKVIAEQEHLTAKAAYEQARIDLKLARYKLQTFGLSNEAIQELTEAENPNLLRYEIHSPMDGIIVRRNLTRGAVVEPNTTIFEVADLNTVLVEIGVFPKDQHILRKGQRAIVSIPSQNISSAGEIAYVSPMITECCITSTSMVELDNSDGLWRPGTVVQVKVDLKNKDERLETPQEIENIVLTTRKGVPVRVSDVAEVRIGREQRTGSATKDGREVVIGTALMLTSANSRTVSAALDQRLQEISKILPRDVQITVVNRPASDQQHIAMQVVRIPSISLTQSTELQMQVERALKSVPEVAYVFSKTGTNEFATDPISPNLSNTFMMLKPLNAWPNPQLSRERLIANLKEALKPFIGNRYRFTHFLGTRSDIVIQIYGDDLLKMHKVAENVAKMLADIPGATAIKIAHSQQFPAVDIKIDREVASRYGLNASDALDIVAIATGGGHAGQISEGDRRFDEVGDLLRFGGFRPARQLADLFHELLPLRRRGFFCLLLNGFFQNKNII